MEYLKPIFFGAVLVIIFMSLLWYIGKQKNNYGIVDVGWTLSLVILAVVYFFFTEGFFLRKLLITSMVCFWGLRLGGYLFFTRILGNHPEDQRYTQFRKEYGEAVDRKFFTNIFMFQGLLDVVLSLPFLLACVNNKTEIHALEWFAVFLFVFAVCSEALADYQLHKFKQDPANKGKNCEVGLWYYSRHPNYFFEWVIWVSWGLFALPSEYGFLGLISPILMYIFLTKFTGVPMTEKFILEKKGDVYREYQKTTSEFFPWFKKIDK